MNGTARVLRFRRPPVIQARQVCAVCWCPTTSHFDEDGRSIGCRGASARHPEVHRRFIGDPLRENLLRSLGQFVEFNTRVEVREERDA